MNDHGPCPVCGRRHGLYAEPYCAATASPPASGSGCACGHARERHWNGRGMCEGTAPSGFSCSCRRFKLPARRARNNPLVP